MAEGLDAAKALESNRVVASTSATYLSRINKMKAYFTEEFPQDMDDEGESYACRSCASIFWVHLLLASR